MSVKDGHSFCKLKDLASRATGDTISTLGFVTFFDPTTGLVKLSFENSTVKVNTKMLDPQNYTTGSLFFCLGYVEKDRTLLAKILRASNELNVEKFLSTVYLGDE